MDLPDIVKDAKLTVLSHGPGKTVHEYISSGDTPELRVFRRTETWHRHPEPLGQGAFGVVWKETFVEPQRGWRYERAVKEIRLSNKKVRPQDYARELEAIMKFSHGNVGALLLMVISQPRDSSG